jgi:galactonate dehydratase
MKITAVTTHLVYAGMRNWLLVRIDTDEGLIGVGEATVEGKELAVAAAIGHLAEYLVGRDPMPTSDLWQAMYQAFWKGGPILMSALAGVDIALWDLKGKVLGRPIFDLLGGPVRSKVLAYTHVRRPGVIEGTRVNMWWEDPSQDSSADVAVDLVKRGYLALKTGPFVEHGLVRDRGWLTRTAERVAMIREAVGPSIEIMIDLHGRLEPASAIRFAASVADYDVAWLEEPVPPENLDSLARVAQKTTIPIATGERLYTKADFWRLLQLKCVDFIQPDICHCGGITEFIRIASMAEACDVLIAPHNPLGPVATAASLQVGGAFRNCHIQEAKIDDVPWRTELTNPSMVPVDGYFSLPSGPGLGIEVDWESVKAHPYQSQPLPRSRNLDGSVAIW